MMRNHRRVGWFVLSFFLIGGALAGSGAVGPVLRNWVNRSADSAHRPMFDARQNLLKRGQRHAKAVSITIDDGPHEGSCEQLLEALASSGARATFFVVGSRVQLRPDLVRRMIAEGHEVGNHTMTHPRLDTLNALAVRSEIALCADSVRSAADREMTLFRPPGMRSTPAVLRQAKELGYVTIDWTTGAKDFTGPNGRGIQSEPDPERIAHRVLTNVSAGSIVLLHDTPSTAKALPAILIGLRERGFEIVSLSQMLASMPAPIWVTANPASPSLVAKARLASNKAASAKRRNAVAKKKKSKRIAPDSPRLEHWGDSHYLHVPEQVSDAMRVA